MNKSLIFSVLLGVSATLGIVLFFSYQPKEIEQSTAFLPPAPDLVTTSTLPTITIKDIVLKEHGKDKHYELTVKAKESTVYHATDTIECKNVVCHITQQGKQIAQLTAEKSIVDRPGKKVVFSGPVSGSFKDIAMRGRDITYNFAQQIITTNKPATYTHASFNLNAQQSVVDIKTQKIILKNGVKSVFLYSPAANNSNN